MHNEIKVNMRLNKKWKIDPENILLQIPAYAVWKDCDSIIRGCNHNFAKWCKLEIDQIIGKHIKEIYPLEFSERYRTDDLEVMQTGRGMIYLEEKPHGAKIEKIVVYKFPLRDEKDKIIGTISLFHELQESWK